MCDGGHVHDHNRFGFFLETPELHALMAEAAQQVRRTVDPVERITTLEPAFTQLLSTDHWLPDAFAEPDMESRMGDGIGQYALYRAEDGSLCLFTLVVPPGARTPVHNRLAWGLVGLYRRRQRETVCRRLDDGRTAGHDTACVWRTSSIQPLDWSPRSDPTMQTHLARTDNHA